MIYTSNVSVLFAYAEIYKQGGSGMSNFIFADKKMQDIWQDFIAHFKSESTIYHIRRIF